MSRVLAILLAGAMATACTPGRIDRVGVDLSLYPAQQYQFVPYTRAMKADVSGRLFGMEQPAFDQSGVGRHPAAGRGADRFQPISCASGLRTEQHRPQHRLPGAGFNRLRRRCHPPGRGLVPGQRSGAHLSVRFDLGRYRAGRSALPAIPALSGGQALPATLQRRSHRPGPLLHPRTVEGGLADQAADHLEFRRSGPAQPFEQHHFGGRQPHAGRLQPLQRDRLALLRARADGVGHHRHVAACLGHFERRLQDADMGLDAEQDRLTPSPDARPPTRRRVSAGLA